MLQTKDQIKANFDLSSLRVIGSGSAPLSKEMVQGFENEFDVSIINIFGSNENAEKAISVSCGDRHTAVVTQSCKVYTWGVNNYGQLGLDDNDIVEEGGLVGVVRRAKIDFLGVDHDEDLPRLTITRDTSVE